MLKHLYSVRRVIALVVIGAGLAATIAPAEARWRRWGGGYRGGAVAAAAIGGLAAGAIIAGATRPAYGYGYGYGYAPAASYGYAPAYYAPAATYYAPAAATYYAPAYATPVYRAHRPRPVYRRYVSSEPICTIQRKKVWLNRNTYTFRRVTTCR